MNKYLIVILMLLVSACASRKENPLKSTIYKSGYKTEFTSTGPLNNSAVIMKGNDTRPPYS